MDIESASIVFTWHAYLHVPEQEWEDLRDKVFRALGLASAWNDKAGPILADCTGTITHLYRMC